MLGAGYIVGMGSVKVAAGKLVLVKPDEDLFLHRPLDQSCFSLRLPVSICTRSGRQISAHSAGQ
jgi:hypothetical protein